MRRTGRTGGTCEEVSGGDCHTCLIDYCCCKFAHDNEGRIVVVVVVVVMMMIMLSMLKSKAVIQLQAKFTEEEEEEGLKSFD